MILPELSAIARQAAKDALTRWTHDGSVGDPMEYVADAVTTAVLQEVKKVMSDPSRVKTVIDCMCEIDALLALSAPLLQSEEEEKTINARLAPSSAPRHESDQRDDHLGNS